MNPNAKINIIMFIIGICTLLYVSIIFGILAEKCMSADFGMNVLNI